MEELFAIVQNEAYAKLMLAMFLGLCLGIERSISGKRAGMRTFALVSLGSCLFVVISEMVGLNSFPNESFNPTHIAAAIVTGIGFLGAGVIIYQQELKGLTTAAGLWTSAGIGVAAGYGLFSLAIFATFLSLLVFTVMWHLEQFLEKQFGVGQNDDRNHNHDHS